MTQSNEPTIAHMNEVIASFMGASRNGGWMMIPHRKYSLSSRYYPSQLKYHTSWDWLMPVVEKCHKVCSEKEKEFDHNNVHDANDPTGWRAWNCRRIYLSTDIRPVHDQVFEFIQWYNNQTTTNE